MADKKHWFSTSSGKIEFRLSYRDASYGSQRGQCDSYIAELRQVSYIDKQLSKIEPETLAQELQEYGCWDSTELADHEENLNRILWLACGDIKENNL